MKPVALDDRRPAQGRAAGALANFGLSIPDAMRMFLMRVTKEGGLPIGATTDTQAHDAWFREKCAKL